MTIVGTICDYALKPGALADPIIDEPKTSSCLDSIIARLLLATQLVVSAIAIPIILAVGLIAAMANAFRGEGINDLKHMTSGLMAHLFAIPLSILGIIAPLSVTKSIFQCIFDQFDIDNTQETEMDHSIKQDLSLQQEEIDGEQLDLKEFRALDQL